MLFGNSATEIKPNLDSPIDDKSKYSGQVFFLMIRSFLLVINNNHFIEKLKIYFCKNKKLFKIISNMC